jgi:hypothetical protein
MKKSDNYWSRKYSRKDRDSSKGVKIPLERIRGKIIGIEKSR